MPDSTNVPPPAPHTDTRLADLQSVIDVEIPMCRQMGVRVVDLDDQGLLMSFPLDQNRNHQGTAFAGSLNALCTITGWGATYLETQSLDPDAVIVIRRSQIKYHRPVDAPLIVARCLHVSDAQRSHFAEMLAEKGQAKLDFDVQIDHAEFDDRPRVVFRGSYVAIKEG